MKKRKIGNKGNYELNSLIALAVFVMIFLYSANILYTETICRLSSQDLTLKLSTSIDNTYISTIPSTFSFEFSEDCSKSQHLEIVRFSDPLVCKNTCFVNGPCQIVEFQSLNYSSRSCVKSFSENHIYIFENNQQIKAENIEEGTYRITKPLNGKDIILEKQ